MTNHTDPFTWPQMPPSVEACKASEQAKMAPTADMPPDPAKLKKKPPRWPDDSPPGGKKKPRPPYSPVAPELPTRPPLVYQGHSWGEIIRALLLLAAAIAAALIID